MFCYSDPYEAIGEQAIRITLFAVFPSMLVGDFEMLLLSFVPCLAGSGHFEKCWSGGRPRKVAKQSGSCVPTA